MHIKYTISSKVENSSVQSHTKTSTVSSGFDFLESIDVLVRCLWREGPPRSKLYGFLKDSEATYVSKCAPFLNPKKVVYKDLNRIDPPKCGIHRIDEYPEPTAEQLEMGCYCIGTPIVLQILQYLSGWFEALFDYSDRVAELIDLDCFESLYRKMDVGLENFVSLAKYFTVYPMAKFFQNPLPAKPAFYLGSPLMFTGKLKRFLKSRIVSYNKSSAKLCWTILQGVKRATEVVPPEYVVGSLKKHRKGMAVDLTGQFDWAYMDDFSCKMEKLVKGFRTKTDLYEASTHASYENKKNDGGQRAEIINRINEHGERLIKVIETRPGQVEEVTRFEHTPVFSEITNLLDERENPLKIAAFNTVHNDIESRWLRIAPRLGLPDLRVKPQAAQPEQIIYSDFLRKMSLDVTSQTVSALETVDSLIDQEWIEYEKSPEYVDLLKNTIEFLNLIQIETADAKRSTSKPIWLESDDLAGFNDRILKNHDALMAWKHKWNPMTYTERVARIMPVLRYETNERLRDEIILTSKSKFVKSQREVRRQSRKKGRKQQKKQGVDELEISDDELVAQFGTLDEKLKYTSLKLSIEEYEAKASKISPYSNFRDLPRNHLLTVDVKPVLEPLKVRLITVGESVPYYMSKFFQKSMHSFLRTKPQFQLIGKPLTPHILGWLDTASKDLERKTEIKFDFWVSGDYSAATDGLSADYTKAAFEAFLDRARCSSLVKETLRQVIYGQKCEYPQGKGSGNLPPVLQTNGQLMGSPLSFPILCVVNLVAYWISMERYLESIHSHKSKLKLKNLAALINGDDILFRSNKEHYEIWKETIKEVGFELSPGKNYCHRDYLTVNSELYYVKEVGGINTFEKIDYFNVGLLKGQSKLNSTAEKSRPKPIWSTYNIVLQGATNKARAHKRFLKHNSEAIELGTNGGEYNLFAHQLLGGLGCILHKGVQPYFTNFQYKLALFLREKALRPCQGRTIRTSRFYKGIVSKSTRLTEPLVTSFKRITPILGEGPLPEGDTIYCDPSATEDLLTRQYEFDSPVFHVQQISAPLMKQFRKTKFTTRLTDDQVMNFPIRFVRHGFTEDTTGLPIANNLAQRSETLINEPFSLEDYEE